MARPVTPLPMPLKSLDIWVCWRRRVIIGWEIVAGVLCWWAFARMIRLLRAPAAIFARDKELAVAALTVGLLRWFVAFLFVGAQ